MNRATDDFRAGRIEQSVAGFDRVAKLSPADAPYLWQRGIAQYYAGRFADCRDMFVSHRTVNPDDVENAAWHFLCAARAESVDAARKNILPVGPDARIPMREVYQMFLGRLTPAQVLSAAGSDTSAQFFARLYVGPLSRGHRRCHPRARTHCHRRRAPLRRGRRLHARRRQSPYDAQQIGSDCMRRLMILVFRDTRDRQCCCATESCRYRDAERAGTGRLTVLTTSASAPSRSPTRIVPTSSTPKRAGRPRGTTVR